MESEMKPDLTTLVIMRWLKKMTDKGHDIVFKSDGIFLVDKAGHETNFQEIPFMVIRALHRDYEFYEDIDEYDDTD